MFNFGGFLRGFWKFFDAIIFSNVQTTKNKKRIACASTT